MHGAGGGALLGDDLVFVDLEPFAEICQLFAQLGAAERLAQPVAQGAPDAPLSEMGCDHRLLARLKGAIKIVGKDDIAGDEAARTEGVLELARQIDQHETCARFFRSPLDLGEAVHRG